MNKFIKLIGVAIIGLLLSACEKEDALMQTPSVSTIGTFDDCVVKYVNRGYESTSFFLASCPGAVTATNRYTTSNGKQTTSHNRTTITKEIEKLQSELNDVSEKESALAKLNEQERKALGIN